MGSLGSMTVVKDYKMALKYYTHSDFVYVSNRGALRADRRVIQM